MLHLRQNDVSSAKCRSNYVLLGPGHHLSFTRFSPWHTRCFDYFWVLGEGKIDSAKWLYNCRDVNRLNVTARTLQNWEAGKGTSQIDKKTRYLRELLTRMDDYIAAPKERERLSSPLDAFAGRTPRELIADGRIRDMVVEFDRLREGQPV